MELTSNKWSAAARAAAAKARKAKGRGTVSRKIAADALRRSGRNRKKALKDVQSTASKMGATHAHQFHWREASKHLGGK